MKRFLPCDGHCRQMIERPRNYHTSAAGSVTLNNAEKQARYHERILVAADDAKAAIPRAQGLLTTANDPSSPMARYEKFADVLDVEPDPDDTQAIAKYAVKLLPRALLDDGVMQR
jgi:hypothetical protein